MAAAGSAPGGGHTLEDLVAEDQVLPYFVEKCVSFIEEEGLTVEGIYRVPGNRQHVDLLLEKFKEGEYLHVMFTSKDIRHADFTSVSGMLQTP